MATRTAKIFINGQEVAGEIGAITKAKSELVKVINKAIIGSKEYEDAVRDLRPLNAMLDDHRKKISGVESTWAKLGRGAGVVAGAAGIAVGADMLVEYGKELFNTSVGLDTLQRKATTVFRETLPEVTRAAQENAAAMGLTNSQYIANAAEIQDLLVPLGFMRSEAADMSVQLNNLSGVLAEWSGGQFTATETAGSLRKALLGEREELERYGISLKQSEVNARIAEKGLKGLTGQALQQAEAMVTLEAVLEKSADAQKAYADNSDSVIRRSAEMSAKFANIKESLATTLLPVFERLLSFAGGLADGLANVTDFIGDMVDPAKAATAAFDDQAAKVNGLEKELNPLLARYDELTSKSTLTKDEQAELAKIIKRVGEITPGAVTSINDYGEALSINAGASREFLEAERARLLFTQREAIKATEQEIESLRERKRVLKIESSEAKGYRDSAFARKLSDQELLEVRKNLAETTTLLSGAESELKRLRGEPVAAATNSEGETPEQAAARLKKEQEARLAAEAKRQEEADKRRKEAEKERKERERELERLQETTDKFSEAARLAALTEDERRLEEVRLRYEKEIEIARTLEAAGYKSATVQRIELERLQAEELAKVREEINAKEVSELVESLTALTEAELKAEEDYAAQKKERQAKLKEASDELLLSDRELAIQEIQEFYEALLREADYYGLNREEIERNTRLAIEQVNKEYDKKDKETLQKNQAERLKVLQTAFTGVSELFGSVLDFLSNEESEFAGFKKAITLAQIAIDTASAISSLTAASEANPANAVTAGIAAVAQFAGGIARIIANMAKAKELLSTPVPQKYTGGWLNAVGQDDGTSYRAQYIGAPLTGMLPNHPVLMASASGGPVLASERGQEYFVSNRALSNPAVLGHVRAIDNIVRTRQMAAGGFTGSAPASSATSGGALASAIPAAEFIEVLSRMATVLESGIFARVDDDFIVALLDRIRKLNTASGGTLN